MFKKIAAAAALVIASSAAFAQQAPQFYVGADAASTKVDGFDRDEGAGIFVGYKFNQNVAVEAGWHQLADMNERVFGDKVNVKYEQTEISLIGTLPLSNGFSVYGRLGYNEVKGKLSGTVDGVRVSESGTEDKVVYGAGLSYAFTPAIDGRLEVQKPHSDITKIAAGVVFNF